MIKLLNVTEHGSLPLACPQQCRWQHH